MEWTALTCFALVASGLNLAHEPWRDEYQALLLGRAATSIADVIELARYEGHPSLWYILLHLLPDIGKDVMLAKGLNLLFIIAAAGLVLFKSPFPRWQRIATVGGYFFLYEYAAFFRNYAMAVMLALGTIACLMSDHRRMRVLAFLPLIVLPHTQVYGTLMGMALFGAMLLQRVQGSPWMPRTAWVVGSIAFLASIALAIADIKPAPDGDFYGSWGFDPERTISALGIPLHVFIPFPSLRMDFWNKPIVDDLLHINDTSRGGMLKAFLAIVCLITATRSLKGSAPAQAFFLGTTLLILSFCAIRFHGNLRHHGMIFVAFLGARWMARSSFMSGERSSDAYPIVTQRWVQRSWGIVLVLHVLAGIQAGALDVLYPFSGSNGVASFLIDKGWSSRPIMAQAEHCGISVAGALSRPIMYPSTGAEGTYIPWDNKRRWGISNEEYLELFQGYAHANPDALLLTSEPLPPSFLKASGLREVYCGSLTIQRDERFALYLLDGQDP